MNNGERTTVKTRVIVAILIATLVAEVTTFAAVSSLPIGSVDKFLKHYLEHTDQIGVNIQSANSSADLDSGNVSILFMGSWRSYTKADGSTESIEALCKRSALLPDQTELKALIESMLREAMRVSVDPNDPTLQGKVIMAMAGGDWQPDVNNYLQWIGTFTIDNRFVLGSLKDGQGASLIPETAFGVDLLAGTVYANGMVLFLDGVSSAEILTGNGGLMEQVFIPYWWSNKLAVVTEDFVFGQYSGTVRVNYGGTSQVFNLADGTLLSPLPTLTVGACTTQTPSVCLTVSGSLGPYCLEYRENLSTAWKNLAFLTNTVGTVSMTNSASGQSQFYRVRFMN